MMHAADLILCLVAPLVAAVLAIIEWCAQ